MNDKNWLGVLQFPKLNENLKENARSSGIQPFEQSFTSNDDFFMANPSDNHGLKGRRKGFDKESHEAHTKTLYTQYQQSSQDLGQFIANTKSLKQKIYEKLANGKKTTKFRKQRINQATFNPHPLKDRLSTLRSKQNRPEAHDIPKNYIYRKSNKKVSIKQNKNTSQLYALPWRIIKQGSCCDKVLTLNFFERQQRTIRNKQLTAEKIKDRQKQKQLQQCTFSPTLTLYKVKKR